MARISYLNPKYKISDIKSYSDEYMSLTKEKYKQFNLLKNKKKSIKDIIQEFENLIKFINEKSDKLGNLNLYKEINTLREELSGDEENIFNKIIMNKTIILEDQNNINNINIKPKNLTKNIKLLFASRTKNIKLKKKDIIRSKSCYDMINYKENNNNDDKDINEKKDINYYNLDNLDYNIISNNDFKIISLKKQKYLNVAEKLDKSINDISILYENRTKEISNLIDINSKKLSNIQQENELLKSEIADMKRIYESNKKNKMNNMKNINKFNKRYEDIIKRLDICKNNSDIISKNIEKENYIDMIKKKYKIKEKNKIVLLQKERLSNN